MAMIKIGGGSCKVHVGPDRNHPHPAPGDSERHSENGVKAKVIIWNTNGTSHEAEFDITLADYKDKSFVTVDVLKRDE